MAFPDSGSVVYQDSYDTIYEMVWETVVLDDAEVIDFTTVTKQPHVWGEADSGYVQNNNLFRRGICTTTRQILIPLTGGYEILAEGATQSICIYQATFNCGTAPTDPFAYHLDCAINDPLVILANCGPRFADPDNPNDDNVRFHNVDTNGDLTIPATCQPFEFVNVWGDNDNITSVCPTDCTM